MAFRIGQEVTPINKDPWRLSVIGVIDEDHRDPKFGQIYIISSIKEARTFAGTVLRFKGCGITFYDALDFRPVQKTSISIFTAMLSPSPMVKEHDHEPAV